MVHALIPVGPGVLPPSSLSRACCRAKHIFSFPIPASSLLPQLPYRQGRRPVHFLPQSCVFPPCFSSYPIGKGADLFISVWNLHHSPHLWKDPDTFNPDRYEEKFSNDGFKVCMFGK